MPRTHLLLIPGAAVWVAAVVAIAYTDGFVVTDTPPWPILMAALIPIAAFAALLRTPLGRNLIQGLDPSLLVAVQMWRVVGAAFLFGWANGELDAGFAIPAGIGDIATGIAALVMLGPLQRHALTRRHLIWFTSLGVGDFAVAVATGALIGPEKLELLPWVLFPALAVPFFSIIHIINWIHLAPLTAEPPIAGDRRFVSESALPGARVEQDRRRARIAGGA